MRETLQAYTGATKNVSLLAPKAPSLSVGGLTHYNLPITTFDTPLWIFVQNLFILSQAILHSLICRVLLTATATA